MLTLNSSDVVPAGNGTEVEVRVADQLMLASLGPIAVSETAPVPVNELRGDTVTSVLIACTEVDPA